MTSFVHSYARTRRSAYTWAQISTFLMLGCFGLSAILSGGLLSLMMDRAKIHPLYLILGGAISLAAMYLLFVYSKKTERRPEKMPLLFASLLGLLNIGFGGIMGFVSIIMLERMPQRIAATAVEVEYQERAMAGLGEILLVSSASSIGMLCLGMFILADTLRRYCQGNN